ncbi:MAG TPA: hypothetical protein V6D48_09250 [Oculatellaceae cyanobacterium]
MRICAINLYWLRNLLTLTDNNSVAKSKSAIASGQSTSIPIPLSSIPRMALS